MAKISIKVKSEMLYELIEKAVDNFKLFESQIADSIDIEACTQDYIAALLIFNCNLYETKIVD